MGTKTKQTDTGKRWDARCRNEEANWMVHSANAHRALAEQKGRELNDGEKYELHKNLIARWK